MSEVARKVIYTSGPEELVVHNLSGADINLETAHDVLTLLEQAYSHQFEKEARGRFRLPAGTISKYFISGSMDWQYGQHSQMWHDIDHGFQYWVVRDDGVEESPIVSLAKVAPSKPAGLTMYDEYKPDCYVSDLVTLPHFQRQGLASAGLHAALTHGGFNPQGIVMLDGFIGNMGPNRLFARTMGLRRQPDESVSPWVLWDRDEQPMARLPQVRYRTPQELTLDGVVQRLEKRKQWLKTATPASG